MDPDTETTFLEADSRLASASSFRRHSCATYHRAISHTESTPIKILARSITQGAMESNSTVANMQRKILIDSKFIDLYVKKGKQNECIVTKQIGPVGKRLSCDSSIERKNSDKSILEHTKNGIEKDVHNKDLVRCVSSRLHYGEKSAPNTVCYRILESLFVGGTNAAFDHCLMRRLKMDHFIDFRNMNVRKEAKHAQTNLPSTMPDQKTLSLCIDQFTSNTTLDEYFQQINEFITKARTQGKRVLVYDHDDGRCEAAASVVQYLINYYNMAYSEAHDFIIQIIPGVKIPANFEHVIRFGCKEKAPISNTHQLTNGKAYCRQGVNYDGSKKHLAWA